MWSRMWRLPVILLALALALVTSTPPSIDAHDETVTFPLMHPDEQTLWEWVKAYDSAARTASFSASRSAALSGGSVDLLSHMVHIPSERSQGACGNCWVWAGTGCMEIALSVQEGVQERLSIQVVNSCRDILGKYCCQGGWLHELATFYETTGRALPWDNVNADWQDQDGTCTVPCEAIATEPYYDIVHMRMLTIPTLTAQDVATREQAIANIKAELDSGKGVWFAFFAPSAGWQQFYSYWSGQPETAVINMDSMCSGTTNGGGHAVLCVGYNDTDPNNRYWVMLNSWGTAGGNRPNGLFRVNMDMDYNTRCGIQAFFWQTLDISFRLPPQVSTDSASQIAAQVATVHGTLQYDSGTATGVRFEYGTVSGGPYPDASPWQEAFPSGDTFEADLTGLHGGTRYYFRAEATNSGGTAYGDELSFLTKPVPPMSFSAQANGETEAAVSWHSGEGAETIVVWRKKDSPPAVQGDGYLVYEGSGTAMKDTSLDPGSRYYYRAWSSLDDSLMGTVWSDESSMDCAHTIGNGVLLEGDVNLDAEVNVADAIALLQYTIGLRELDMNCILAGDSTDDGLVNVSDAVLIMQFTVDPGGSLRILSVPLWRSPQDDAFLNPLNPCGA